METKTVKDAPTPVERQDPKLATPNSVVTLKEAVEQEHVEPAPAPVLEPAALPAATPKRKQVPKITIEPITPATNQPALKSPPLSARLRNRTKTPAK